MAFEIEVANIAKQTDVIAGIASEAFVQTDSVLPLIATQVFNPGTPTILFPKLGKVEAGTQAESAAYSYNASDEVTDSTVSATAAMKTQAQKMTIAELTFGGVYATMERHIRLGAQALQRLAASELKTQFSSITNVVTATSTLTVNNLLDARYNIESSVLTAGLSTKLVGMFDYKALNEINKELIASTASSYVSQVDLGVLGMVQAGKPKGDLYDILLYATNGLPLATTDDVACVWDPSLAFCAGVQATPFELYVTNPAAATPWFEAFLSSFWDIKIWNNTAACRVLSDT